MTPVFILVLFIGTGGISVAGYKTFAACERAGYIAIKDKQIEFLCVPAEIRLDQPPKGKART